MFSDVVSSTQRLLFLGQTYLALTYQQSLATTNAMPINLDPAQGHLQRLAQARDWPKTLCPSEVARALSPVELRNAGASEWRELMPDLRSLCFQLRDQGRLEILQRGEVVTTTEERTRGPIRIRRVQGDGTLP